MLVNLVFVFNSHSLANIVTFNRLANKGLSANWILLSITLGDIVLLKTLPVIDVVSVSIPNTLLIRCHLLSD